jgi:hypothetical protein
MDDFPDPLAMKTVSRAREAMAHGYGYSTGPTIYFRFRGKLNPEHFPTVKETMDQGAALFLVDVDPNSPERGRHFPLEARYYPHGPSIIKSATSLLAFMPMPGFVLRENTLYAAGVLRSLGDAAGQALAQHPDLTLLVHGQTPDQKLGPAAFAAYGPALMELTSQGLRGEDLAALTVFRTGDPTRRMLMLFDGVKDMTEFEWETPLHPTRDYDLYTVLEGAVLLPQFQDGVPPYSRGRGGRIHFDEAGKPIVQRLDRVPVAFSIPKGVMPAAGFPITIYIHGTGGVSTQFIDRGEVTEDSPTAKAHGVSALLGETRLAPEGTGPALILAARGISGVGPGPPHAGERGGLAEQLWYYNFLSAEALRDNMLQAAAEAAMLLRIVKGLELDPALCPGTDAGGGPVRFDPELIFGMGQSLGSLILGPWGAVETELKVLIPSGNGAYWSMLISEGNAADLKSLQQRRLGQGDLLHLDRFHPIIALLANVLAEGDPFAYQPHYFLRPFPGRAPKHVWASFGILDNYFFPPCQNAAMLAMGLDFAGPILEPETEEALMLAGRQHYDYTRPLSGNIPTPAGLVTAVAVQFEEHGPMNGHHVNFQRDDAKYQYGCFLWSMVREGTPTLYPPRLAWDAPCGE